MSMRSDGDLAGLTMGPCSHVDQLEGVAVAIGGGPIGGDSARGRTAG